MANGYAFPAECRTGVYEAILKRRDTRVFLPDPVPEEVLARLLHAAHHGPSVGYMQPWNFIVIRDVEVKRRVKKLFGRAREIEATEFSGERQDLYRSLRLEGIEEAPVNLCVTCDPSRSGPAILGRRFAPDTPFYSTCCAIQNLWLAARVEGLGVGWVSILEGEGLRQILQIPPSIVPVAYLCVGYASAFAQGPYLEEVGWAARIPLTTLIYEERWKGRPQEKLWRAVLQELHGCQCQHWREDDATGQKS
jgi:5,6-dimethylbenzimidazole synthase